MLRVTVDEVEVAEALIEAGLLRADDAEDRVALAAALSEALAHLVSRVTP